MAPFLRQSVFATQFNESEICSTIFSQLVSNISEAISNVLKEQESLIENIISSWKILRVNLALLTSDNIHFIWSIYH